MNYESVIVELLSRIQVLEEKVALLMNERRPESQNNDREAKVTTNDIREHINVLKSAARNEGEGALILRSGDIHRKLNLKNAMPQVCNAMRQCMEGTDKILHQTPSGNSSTFTVEYTV